MAAATEFAPVVFIPPRARPADRPDAVVLPLFGPAGSPAASWRLTRRGVRAVAATVALLATLLVVLARVSAPATAPTHSSIPAAVTVQPGDTLWAIATRIAPDRDPRAEVADLQRLNGLAGVQLTVGQLLRTR